MFDESQKGFAEKMLRQSEFTSRCCPAILASLILTLLLQGCLSRAPAPAPAIVHPENPGAFLEPPVPEQSEIERLLEEAAEAMDQNRLTTPPEDCAYYRYLRVLSLDPVNRMALQGISDIVEQYLDWAIQQAGLNNFKRAEKHLGSARTVDETHPNVEAVAEQIAQKRKSRFKTYRLSTEGLSDRAGWITEELLEIGTEVQDRNATVVITARTDREARWIYQQLNLGVDDVRVRAEVKLGRIPSVHLIYPPSP
jgi:hypothetical protein